MASSSLGAPGLRPLSVGEILDAAIKICVRNARTLAVLAAIVVLPFAVLSGFVTLSTTSTASEVSTGFGGLRAADHASALGGQAIVSLIGLLVGLLTTAACVKAVSDVYLDQPPTVGGSLGFAARRLGALFLLEILLAIGLGIAFLFFIVPGIYLYAAWAVATPALLIEGLRAPGSLGRSYRLVRGRWWQTAGILLVVNIMITVIGFTVAAALIAIAFSGATHSLTSTVFLTSLASAAASILTRPFQAAVTTVLYYDLRVRHEGYDIQLLAQQVGMLPPGPPGTPALAPLPGPLGTPGGGSSGAPAPPPGPTPSPGAPLSPPPGPAPSPSPAPSPGSALPPGPALPPAAPPFGPDSVGRPGGPPFWPPPPGWRPPAPGAGGGQ
jgi:hypothetical protein